MRNTFVYLCWSVSWINIFYEINYIALLKMYNKICRNVLLANFQRINYLTSKDRFGELTHDLIFKFWGHFTCQSGSLTRWFRRKVKILIFWVPWDINNTWKGFHTYFALIFEWFNVQHLKKTYKVSAVYFLKIF